MKSLNLISAFILSLVFFVSCDEDNIDYAFQEISAPEEVTAVFDVTPDDTGTVTITPAAKGASEFRIFFGAAENEEPVIIASGQSAQYVYPEGEYIVRVVAVGATGLTSEYSQKLVISFRAPENLEIQINQPANDPRNITVSATAAYAALFEVYFGDVENEEPTQLMPGGQVPHTYTAPGTYTVRVVARGAGVATTEATATVVIPEANDPVVLPINFDLPTVNYALGVFNGASFEVVANPELSGVNTKATKVGALTNSGNNWEGGAWTLGTPADFSGQNKKMTMKMYSTVSVPVLMKFEGGVNGERQNEVSAVHGGTGWEELVFDFGKDAVKSYIDGTQGVGEPFVPTGQYETLVLFIDGPGNTAGTFYIDDVAQEPADPNAFAVVENFEGAAPTFTVFGNIAPTVVVANPDASGENTTSNVARLTKSNGAEIWAGTFFETSPLDLNTYRYIRVKTWSPKAGAVVKLKLENQDASVTYEVDANTTVANAWETLYYDFADAPAADYVRVVIFFDFGNNGDGSEYYYDEIELTNNDGSGPVVSVFQDFEGTAPSFTVFGNIAATEVVSNPDQSGANVSANVAQLTKSNGAEIWAGTFFEVGTPLDLTNFSKIAVKTWSPKSGAVVKVKLENQDASVTHEVDVNTTVANGWEQLVYDFSGAAAADYVRVVIFFDFGNNGDGSVYYFDDFGLTN